MTNDTIIECVQNDRGKSIEELASEFETSVGSYPQWSENAMGLSITYVPKMSADQKHI